MTQSRLPIRPPGLHVAIVMDGNGRWAAERGLARSEGHRAGARAVRRVLEAAPRLGVGTLTLFAFSCDNWQRPEEEVAGLMRVLQEFLEADLPRCVAEGIRVRVVGRRDRLPEAVRSAIQAIEAATASGRSLGLRLAVDYSGREAILAAARRPGSAVTPEEFGRLVARYGEVEEADGADPRPAGGTTEPDVAEVDVLLRTGGERRLSDFLLWECAYSELMFCDTKWPDFSASDLEAALAEFRRRDRRFGAASRAPAARQRRGA